MSQEIFLQDLVTIFYNYNIKYFNVQKFLKEFIVKTSNNIYRLDNSSNLYYNDRLQDLQAITRGFTEPSWHNLLIKFAYKRGFLLQIHSYDEFSIIISLNSLDSY